MNCDQARTEIIAYLKDELTQDEKKRFEEHLARCPACRHELEGARRVLRWTEAASEDAVVKCVEEIIDNAIRASASDIHLEPQRGDSLLVRYRVDGVLHEAATIDPLQRHGVITRLKMMADMDVSEERAPQDGRIIHCGLDGAEYNLRASSCPTVLGESVVIRILDHSRVLVGLDRLGMADEDLRKFKELLESPCGMIVVSGPTGSGKTTTLYSALGFVNSPQIKVLTIENPVEYLLPGVVQVAVNKPSGLTFASALRSFLRQDPDVIMLGEMPDQETVEIAISGALTGHLVLSSLHTNDAPSVLIRMVDMGAEPYLLGATVAGVVAQRLVRTICPDCKEAYEIKASELRKFGFAPIDDDETLTLWRGRGCESCRQTGYKGRIGLYELMVMNAGIGELILRRASLVDFKEAARLGGMTDMREDGLRKTLQGITTVQEVVRVFA